MVITRVLLDGVVLIPAAPVALALYFEPPEVQSSNLLLVGLAAAVVLAAVAFPVCRRVRGRAPKRTSRLGRRRVCARHRRIRATSGDDLTAHVALCCLPGGRPARARRQDRYHARGSGRRGRPPAGLCTRRVFLISGLSRAHVALGRALLGPSRRARLAERVEELTESRSRVLAAALAERRRIERDLHDGAQQRLVSLAMELGMAREKMATEPAAARKLVEEAHGEAKRALSDIRDLVRGIHPAVLSDRGLDAAISALAYRCAVPVEVDVELDGRPLEAVETTAYFVVAETLANVAKHSGTSEARVAVWRAPEDRLVVEVVDDGKGGADPEAGTGLAGLADRLAALDGRLFVESPAGGPTRVRAELPLGTPDGTARRTP